MLKNRYNDITDKLEKVFKFLFLIYLAMGTNCFTMQRPIISFVLWPCFILGTLLVFNRVIHFKRYINMPYWWLLALLLAADLITIVLNRKYDFKGNVILLALWVFYFLILYVRPNDKPSEYIKKELFSICAVYTVWVEILAFISIGMLFAGYTYTESLSYGTLQAGMIYGRLYGAFTDPNLGAISLSIASLFLIYAAVNIYKKLYFRIITGVLIFVNLLYIATTDSRTGAVSMGVCALVVCVKLFLEKWNKNVLLKICSVAFAAVILLVAVMLPTVVQKGYNKTVNVISSIFGSEMEYANDRSDVEDISSGRIDIWESALQSLPKFYVYGTGYSGLTEYFAENIPDNSIGKMDTMDNDTMNILVANGLIGFIPYIAFAFGIFIYCIRRFVKLKKKGFTFELLLLTVTCSLATCSMFRSIIFYSTTLLTALFWLMLGALAYLLKNSETEGETE